jgi:hypothetical protein
MNTQRKHFEYFLLKAVIVFGAFVFSQNILAASANPSLFGDLFANPGVSDADLVANLDRVRVINQIEDPEQAAQMAQMWDEIKAFYRAKIAPGGGGLTTANRDVLNYWYKYRETMSVRLVEKNPLHKGANESMGYGGGRYDELAGGKEAWVELRSGMPLPDRNSLNIFEHESGHAMGFKADRMGVPEFDGYSSPGAGSVQTYWSESVANAVDQNYSLDAANRETSKYYRSLSEYFGRAGASKAELEQLNKLTGNQAYVAARNYAQLGYKARDIPGSITQALNQGAAVSPKGISLAESNFRNTAIADASGLVGKIPTGTWTDSELLDFLEQSIRFAEANPPDPKYRPSRMGQAQFEVDQVIANLRKSGLSQLDREILESAKKFNKKIDIVVDYSFENGRVAAGSEVNADRAIVTVHRPAYRDPTFNLKENMMGALSDFREMELAKTDAMAERALRPNSLLEDFHRYIRQYTVATNGDVGRAFDLALETVDESFKTILKGESRNNILTEDRLNSLNSMSRDSKAQLVKNMIKQIPGKEISALPPERVNQVFDVAKSNIVVPDPPLIYKTAAERTPSIWQLLRSRPLLEATIVDIEKASGSAVKNFFNAKLGVLRSFRGLTGPVAAAGAVAYEVLKPLVAGFGTAMGYAFSGGGTITWDQALADIGHTVQNQVRDAFHQVFDLMKLGVTLSGMGLTMPSLRDLIDKSIDALQQDFDDGFKVVMDAIENENINVDIQLMGIIGEKLFYDSVAEDNLKRLEKILKDKINNKYIKKYGAGYGDCGILAGKKPTNTKCRNPKCDLHISARPPDLVCDDPAGSKLGTDNVCDVPDQFKPSACTLPPIIIPPTSSGVWVPPQTQQASGPSYTPPPVQ